MKRLQSLQQQTKVHLTEKCQLWSQWVPALGNVAWVDQVAVQACAAELVQPEPVQVTAEEIEEELCYKKRTQCVTDIEQLFPDLEESQFVAAAVATCCDRLLYWKQWS